jgi:hypothetical protein
LKTWWGIVAVGRGVCFGICKTWADVSSKMLLRSSMAVGTGRRSKTSVLMIVEARSRVAAETCAACVVKADLLHHWQPNGEAQGLAFV